MAENIISKNEVAATVEQVTGQISLLSYLFRTFLNNDKIKKSVLILVIWAFSLNPFFFSKLSQHLFFFNMLKPYYYFIYWTIVAILLFWSTYLYTKTYKIKYPLKIQYYAPRGPFSFDANDHEIFIKLGRSQDISNFCLKIRSAPSSKLILFTGESGSGKTSLIQAGIIPTLKMFSIKCIYIKLTSEDPSKSLEKLNQIDSKYQSSSQTCVFIDQFEQFFINQHNSEININLIKKYIDLCRKNNTIIIFSFRHEFQASLSELFSNIGVNYELNDMIFLSLFDLDIAAKVICQIAEIARIDYDHDFIKNTIVNKLQNRDGKVSPLQIQLLSFSIARQKVTENKAFTKKAYHKIGGIDGILENYINEGLELIKLGYPKQKRNIFIEVLTSFIDFNSNSSKKEVTIDEIEFNIKTKLNRSQIIEALNYLGSDDIRLIKIIKSEENNCLKYELAHECFIQAIRKIAEREIRTPDVSRLVFYKKLNEWLGNNQSPHYLLRLKELYLTWKNSNYIKVNSSAESSLYYHKSIKYNQFIIFVFFIVFLVLFSFTIFFSSYEGRLLLFENRLLNGSISEKYKLDYLLRINTLLINRPFKSRSYFYNLFLSILDSGSINEKLYLYENHMFNIISLGSQFNDILINELTDDSSIIPVRLRLRYAFRYLSTNLSLSDAKEESLIEYIIKLAQIYPEILEGNDMPAQIKLILLNSISSKVLANKIFNSKFNSIFNFIIHNPKIAINYPTTNIEKYIIDTLNSNLDDDAITYFSYQNDELFKTLFILNKSLFKIYLEKQFAKLMDINEATLLSNLSYKESNIRLFENLITTHDSAQARLIENIFNKVFTRSTSELKFIYKYYLLKNRILHNEAENVKNYLIQIKNVITKLKKAPSLLLLTDDRSTSFSIDFSEVEKIALQVLKINDDKYIYQFAQKGDYSLLGDFELSRRAFYYSPDFYSSVILKDVLKNEIDNSISIPDYIFNKFIQDYLISFNQNFQSNIVKTTSFYLYLLNNKNYLKDLRLSLPYSLKVEPEMLVSFFTNAEFYYRKYSGNKFTEDLLLKIVELIHRLRTNRMKKIYILKSLFLAKFADIENKSKTYMFICEELLDEYDESKYKLAKTSLFYEALEMHNKILISNEIINLKNRLVNELIQLGQFSKAIEINDEIKDNNIYNENLINIILKKRVI